MKRFVLLLLFISVSFLSCKVSKDVVYIPKLKKNKISLRKYTKNFINRIPEEDLKLMTLDTIQIIHNY